jgi:AraC family transcriptional regulator
LKVLARDAARREELPTERKMNRPPAEEPSALSTRKLLLESLGIAVVDFHCHAHGAAGPEEPNPTHSIVFVRRGVFRRTHRHESLIADANHVLFFNTAEPYQYGHPIPGGDVCTILTVETHRALELVRRHAPGDAEHPETPFRHGHSLSSPRALRLHWELLNLVACGATQLALEDTLAELAGEAVACAYQQRDQRRPLSASAQRRRRDLVEAVKLMIGERLDGPPSLTELADVLGCSPYHLSRTFHNTAGESLRRYVRHLRARVAAERLADGARSLTALALDLGYADHSHFTNSFRREWGLTPSAFRSTYRMPRHVTSPDR